MSETKVRPAFKILLLIALVMYIIGVCLIQADLYRKMGDIDHAMMHLAEKSAHDAQEESH
ncbi:MAG: hypothetical protein R6X19_04875 [Kiritimatiellia bacterium]